mmetsp:Transcript_64107/g.171648  ORF Transcript_64107/g.171648 Transcript_64107/m.171648 type:complete len:172 (+) Transcript_64107:19-534(+)
MLGRRLASVAWRNSTRLAVPARWMAEDATAAAGGIPTKLTLNFLAPHQAIMSKSQVDMVIVPGASGAFGVLPGHVPTISELKPGVVEVTKAAGDVAKYFVSSGFAFVHGNSTLDLCTVEAVPLEDLDPSAISSGKSEAESELARATDEVEKAKAQIALDVYTAMSEALNAK